MRITFAMLVALLPAAVIGADGTSCVAAEHNATSNSATTIFQHAGAVLAIATDDPPPSEHKVQVRDRRNLVYSHRPEMPEFISSPTTAAFPLVANVELPSTATEESPQPATTIQAYAHAARALLDERLVSHAAVVLRGLPINDGVEYSAFIDALTDGWGFVAKKLGGGGTQRTELTANVRSASDEPPTQTIEPHMDMAHSVAHPKRMSLFCAAGPPPGVGGETVLTNMRAVYRDLEAEGVVAALEARGGVAYHKRLWSSSRVNHSYTWQQFFFTDELETALAEVRKRDEGARVHEHGPDVIDFREVLPAVHHHPLSGERVWFNGVHTNHHSYYTEAAHVDTSDGPPMDTSYADGTPIADETIAAVRAAYWRNSVAVRFQTGDIAFLDNMLVSHGRMSWVPPAPRRMLLSHFVPDDH